MKWQSSVEALFALLFAVCVLVALLLFAGCSHQGSAGAVTYCEGLAPRERICEIHPEEIAT